MSRVTVFSVLLAGATLGSSATASDDGQLQPLLGAFKGKVGASLDSTCQIAISTEQVLQNRMVLLKLASDGQLKWEVRLLASDVAGAIAKKEAPIDRSTSSGNPVGPNDAQHVILNWNELGPMDISLDIIHKVGPLPVGTDRYGCVDLVKVP